ncbi:MAG: PilT/PilU family type 4a pilus ATPase [Clostridioides sp.]|jgi:twitching motility protein PilT|nr:PilT/PilU family type 4a pilus ATPase [Clostridioides sp.]
MIELLGEATKRSASDLHIVVGVRPVLRVNGKFIYIGDEEVSDDIAKNLLVEISSIIVYNHTEEMGESDFSFEGTGEYRFRVNAYKESGHLAMAIRIINNNIKKLKELGIPEIIVDILNYKSGLILVTGSTGSGKSTTLASMIDYINENEEKHIITIEEPIEYLHKHKKSLVNQREIGVDTKSFYSGVLSSLRQSPDIIMIGEIRDVKTMETALRAAETGHLVLSTLHTLGAVESLDRIVDMFKPEEKHNIRAQLASVCRAIVSQQLILARNEKIILASEVMVVTTAIRNLIREGKNHQIKNLIQTGSQYGMYTMDQFLTELFISGEISKEALISRISDEKIVSELLNGSDTKFSG